jgi:hypothetical protein
MEIKLKKGNLQLEMPISGHAAAKINANYKYNYQKLIQTMYFLKL